MSPYELGALTGYDHRNIRWLIGKGIIIAEKIERKFYIEPDYAKRIIPLLKVRHIMIHSLKK